MSRPRPLDAPHAFSQIPLDAKYIARYYFYGWHVTSDWLRDLPRRYKFPNMFRGGHESADGLRLLRTIYENIHLVDALVEPGETYKNIYTGKGGEKYTMIVAVFVNIDEYLDQKATEGQMLQLIKVFGREPRWFKDAWRMEHFLSMYDYPIPR
jgi:hypothetical protein